MQYFSNLDVFHAREEEILSWNIAGISSNNSFVQVGVEFPIGDLHISHCVYCGRMNWQIYEYKLIINSRIWSQKIIYIMNISSKNFSKEYCDAFKKVTPTLFNLKWIS